MELIAGGADAGASDAGTPAGVCPPQEVACADNQVQDMSLLKKVNPTVIANEVDGSGWINYPMTCQSVKLFGPREGQKIKLGSLL